MFHLLSLIVFVCLDFFSCEMSTNQKLLLTQFNWVWTFIHLIHHFCNYIHPYSFHSSSTLRNVPSLTLKMCQVVTTKFSVHTVHHVRVIFFLTSKGKFSFGLLQGFIFFSVNMSL